MKDRKALWKTSTVAAMLTAGFVSTNAAAQAPGAGAGDFLQAVNETSGVVKLQFFPANVPAGKDVRPSLSACMSPKEAVRWPMDPRVAGEIRLQQMGGNGCEDPPQVACERAIARAPGMQYVAVRGDGKGCGLFPMPAPAPVLMAGSGNQMCGPSGAWAPLTFTNRDPKRAMWVTVYNWNIGLKPNEIRAAACWLPGESRMACLDPGRIILKAEMTEPTDASRPAFNCSGRMTCDTRMDTNDLVHQSQQPLGGLRVDLYPNGNNCYWGKITR
jgi:hypothetical protein